jgi:cell division protein FtsN
MHRNLDEESIAEVDAKIRGINDNWKKYNKRLENIYDNTEIEAEIEAEQKIRSKNAKLTIVSTIGFILLIIIFLKVKQNTNEIQSLLGKNSITKDKTTNRPKIPSTVSLPKQLERINLSQNTNLRIKKFTPNTPKSIIPKIDSKNKYTIQMGVFSNKSNAVNYLKKLKSKGYKAETVTRNSNLFKYQVILGSYNKKSEAAKNITKLKSIGLISSLKKYDQTYAIELGLFKNKVDSEKLINKLNNSGIKSNIKKIKTKNILYIVRINGFLSKLEAKKSHQQLISQGFKNSFIRPS